MQKIKYLICILIIAVYNKAYTKSDTKYVESYTLSNGLNVILMKRTNVPIAHFSIWHKSGSTNDKIGKSGIAHYLEHMAFSLNKGEFNDFLEKIGASKNAFTSANIICFYETFPAKYLHKIIEYEAERIINISLNQKAFDIEKNIILEEQNIRINSNPMGQIFEALSANIFNRTAGGISIIGWKNEIKDLKISDIVDYHKKWIAPNNATIIIIGNMDISETKKLIEKHFGTIKEKNLPKNTYASNDRNINKSITFKSPKLGSMSEIKYVYKVPKPISSNFRKNLALSLAVNSMNQPSFFMKRYFEKSENIAVNFSCDHLDKFFNDDIVILTISCSSIDNLNKVESELPFQMKKFFYNPIDKEAFKDLKYTESLSMAYKNDNIISVAENLGYMISIGYKINDALKYDEIIQNLSIDECSEAIKIVFKNDPIATLRILPKGYFRD